MAVNMRASTRTPRRRRLRAQTWSCCAANVTRWPENTAKENLEEFRSEGVCHDTFVRIFVDVHEKCGEVGGRTCGTRGRARGRSGAYVLQERASSIEYRR